MEKTRVAGPRGTGKTTYLVERYYDALDKYQAMDIVIISHTRTAANHIREKINGPKNIQSYHTKTGKEKHKRGRPKKGSTVRVSK